MAADYQENVCPPQWCWDRMNELTSVGPGCWGPAGWGSMGTTDALAAHIWKYEDPPVDPVLVAVREAIAVFEDASGCAVTAQSIRDGKYPKAIAAALKSLRKSGVLK